MSKYWIFLNGFEAAVFLIFLWAIWFGQLTIGNYELIGTLRNTVTVFITVLLIMCFWQLIVE